MKKLLKVILGIIGLILIYVVIDLISIYTRSKPVFSIKGNVSNMYVGLFYDTYNCPEYSIPQIKFKGTKFACSEPIHVETITEKIVMINETLYYNTGNLSTVDGRCGNMDGMITSTVSKDEVPEVNDQSNFGTGYGYQYINNTIEVLIDGEWFVFQKK